ncbi:hypothetical protein SAMN05428982_2886 [Pseudoxanthomonas sp. CF385]|uniref:hypothetical protein n=1 Tax=Pseudoxanthomonas sp. CF385 TaxID=1881042 RepID=UPI00088B7070|nr:hypothetical protein [Pseudoxanthomonas sp. CF385]SDR01490.1 hypothetical protein SAMN05428982_2886 [Pseudoxanthomonas sp. CF385]
MSDSQPETPDADAIPAESVIHGVDDAPSALEQALQALQGGPAQSLADPGITLLTPAQLDLLYVGARMQADHCQDGLLLLLDLMHGAQVGGAMPDGALMQRFVAQLHTLCRDQQRWHALADNAAYYRDNARVAGRIASWVRVQPAAEAPAG